MKKIKCLCIALAVLLFTHGTAMASNIVATCETDVQSIQSSFNNGIQPYGLYLHCGGCSIKPGGSNRVVVNGYTEAYESSSEVTVQLTVYQEIGTGVWKSVWSDTVYGYNTDYTRFRSRTVWVESGHKYKVEGEHTVKNNGRTETTYSETDGVSI